MRAALLLSVVVHVAAFFSIFKLTKQVVPITVDIAITEVTINKGNKGSKLPHLSQLLPHLGPGRDSSQLDTSAEINKALEEMAEGNPFKKKEHKFYSYYERIKQEIEPLWISGVSDLAITARRQRTNWRISGGQVATIVILIDKNGAVVQVLLVKSSGDVKLDTLAISLMKGRCYPNPPKGLIEADGFGRLVWYYRT